MRKRLGARLEALKVGPVSDPSSDMERMSNLAEVQRVDWLVGAAIVASAEVVVRGGPIRGGPLRIARQIQAGTVWSNNWLSCTTKPRKAATSKAARDD